MAQRHRRLHLTTTVAGGSKCCRCPGAPRVPVKVFLFTTCLYEMLDVIPGRKYDELSFFSLEDGVIMNETSGFAGDRNSPKTRT